MHPLPLIFRLAVLGAGMVVLWRVVLALQMLPDSPMLGRLLQGGLVSVGVVSLVWLLLKRDSLSMADIGSANLSTNIRAFLFGAGLWLLPALIGLALCVGMGWVSIALDSSATNISQTILLFVATVFLIEAFPEELAFRAYAQSLIWQRYAAWIALLMQAALFVAFAWAVGAMHSSQQWSFIPGFALILGFARMVSGNVWTAIGIHTAWMTATQALNGYATVEGLRTLLFLAFTLLPSITIGIVLPLRNPAFKWGGLLR